MAKQTFTTGQVLTASQMTSLQQTAMGGGSATAKTASYVLVAADAGSTVAMNAAGATTITVNTSLFAAGDTVFIQNLGAGACTVTAGTATVATAGSLILPQNDAGILYFTAAGASIFYDFIQAGAVSPLTTKGDVYTFSTSDARLAVGANATVLTADSAEATGLKWATPTVTTPNAFWARPASAQSFSSSTATKITFGTEILDSAGWFASSAFTPLTSGYYMITADICISGGGAGRNILRIYKNGAVYLTVIDDTTSSNEIYSSNSMINANGTTDFFEIYVYSTRSTPAIEADDSAGFQGFFIRA
jgi:hypothetical protein